MVNIDDIYGSSGSLLTAKVVEKEDYEDMDLTIDTIDIGEFNKNYDDPNDETKVKKLVVGFEEIEEQLAVNKTNAGILSKAFGPETDDWIGETIQFIIVETAVGKSVQVRVPKKKKAKKNKPVKINWDRLSKRSSAIDQAVETLKAGGDEVTKENVVAELKAMLKGDEILKEEFNKAGELLGYE
jgi:hypothetical protein